jgi:elongation factor P
MLTPLSAPARAKRHLRSGASPKPDRSRKENMAVDTSQFRNGLKIELDGNPFVITYFQHVKPGKGGAFVRTKVKNLLNGKVLDRTFRSGERCEEPDVQERRLQYLYKDGGDLVFMDTTNYDQIPIAADVVGDSQLFLQENAEVDVLFWKGEAVNIDLPAFVEARVTQSDPGLKGDTSSGATKPATIETGATVQVPLFIKEGDVIRVDTRTREYTERVNK